VDAIAEVMALSVAPVMPAVAGITTTSTAQASRASRASQTARGSSQGSLLEGRPAASPPATHLDWLEADDVVMAGTGTAEQSVAGANDKGAATASSSAASGAPLARLLVGVLPVQLTKAAFTRGLLHASPWVVIKTLRLLHLVLSRFSWLLRVVTQASNLPAQQRSKMVYQLQLALARHCPEMQTLLAVRSRLVARPGLVGKVDKSLAKKKKTTKKTETGGKTEEDAPPVLSAEVGWLLGRGGGACDCVTPPHHACRRLCFDFV